MNTDYNKDALIARLADAVTKTVRARSLPMGTPEYTFAWNDANDALMAAAEWLAHAPVEIRLIARAGVETPYAEGDGWKITLTRHPLSGGRVVTLHTGTTSRVLGNLMGYARPDTAERRADAEAQRQWAREGTR